LGADDSPVPLFPICRGTLPWQSIDLGKCHERRLIPLEFFALSLENELHCLNVHINSGDDVATSCKNLVNFCRVTPEITGLICVPVFSENGPTHLHSSCCHSETPWSIGTLMGALNSDNGQATPDVNLVGF